MIDLLILIHSLSGGGAERSAANLANSYADRGYRVCIATQVSRETNHYPIVDRVEHISLELSSHSRNVVSGLFSNVRRITRTRKFIRNREPHVVLSFMTTQNVINIASSVGLPHRVVVSERNFPTSADGRLWNVLRRILYRYADAVTVQTAAAADWMREQASVKRVAVIPNYIGLPLPLQEPSKNVVDYVSSGTTFILALGRNSPNKGFDLLIEAFAGLDKNFKGQLVIGGFEDASQFQALAQQLGVSDRVVFPGRIGNVAEWYTASSFFVLPSRREGFPNVLLEAMAMGCCVVASDCLDGPRELIRNNEDGLLVPTEDIESLREAMERVIGNPSLRVSLGRSATAVKQRFSESRVLELWDQSLRLPADSSSMKHS